MQRLEIQKFVGALRGQNARKGVFITTSKLQDCKHTSFASLVAEFSGVRLSLAQKMIFVTFERRECCKVVL